jgi:acyl-coenzyme A thioesterase PaaI-like protein
MKTQFVRPIRSGRIRCEGRFLKHGRRISFMETRLTGSDGKLAAMATATWQMLEPPAA